MTVSTARSTGHRTLRLSQIAPAMASAFSPNLYRWMRKHGHFYKDGGVLQTIYRVKPGTRLADDLGEGTLLIGYAEDPHERGFIGVRLMAALCEGAKAGSFYCIGIAPMLDEVAGFWDAYLQVGRCAIDPMHREYFQGDRYSVDGEQRTCLWCGAIHDRVTRPRIVHDQFWEQVAPLRSESNGPIER